MNTSSPFCQQLYITQLVNQVGAKIFLRETSYRVLIHLSRKMFRLWLGWDNKLSSSFFVSWESYICMCLVSEFPFFIFFHYIFPLCHGPNLEVLFFNDSDRQTLHTVSSALVHDSSRTLVGRRSRGVMLLAMGTVTSSRGCYSCLYLLYNMKFSVKICKTKEIDLLL